jgi:sterol desaturase/sphingolipid hydroxylase (fatty acid hydroxylase superfamily)
MTPFMIAAISSTSIILIIELVVVGWKNSSIASLLRPRKTVVNDVFLWFIEMSQIGFIMIYLLTAGIFIKLRPMIGELLGVELQLVRSLSSPILQVIVFAIVVEFLGYALHYIIHHVPPLWAFHKLHHATDKFATVTSSRVHPVERHLFSDVFFLLPFAIVGVPAEYVVVYSAFRFFITTLHHTRLDWDWGWFGKYVIASPQYHRLHHSKLPEHYDKNLVVTFPVFDHIFGTYCGDKIGIDDIGINENPYNRTNIFHDFFIPFRESWQSIFGRSRSE